MKKFYVLFLFALIASVSNLWAKEATQTYTFKSAKWTATEGNWTSNKDGFTQSSGCVQVTTSYSGASATSPLEFSSVKKVDVFYHTNASKGTGDISITIGNNTPISETVSATGGTTSRSLTFTPATAQSGKITIKVNCTQNSIYIEKLEITYENTESQCAAPTFNVEAGGRYKAPKDLVITSATPDALIEYAILRDGETHAEGKAAAPVSITLDSNGDYYVEATAISSDGSLENSDAQDIEFTISDKCATPTFSLTEGTYTTAQSVTITGPEGSTITYTINGVENEAASPAVVELPAVKSAKTTYNISAVASMTDYKDSDEANAVYLINTLLKSATLDVATYATDNDWANATAYLEATANGVTFTVDGTTANDGKYYITNKSWRLYKGSLKVTAPDKHLLNKITFTLDDNRSIASASNGVLTGEVWTAAENESVLDVTFNITARTDITKIDVEYSFNKIYSAAEVAKAGVKVSAAEGGIEVMAAEAANLAIYTIDGQLVHAEHVAEGSTLVNTPAGFYVVRVNETITKVLVK